MYRICDSVLLMKFSREAVAGEVRAALGRQKMTQTDLADRIGISRSTLSRLLSGAQPFDVDQLYRISDVLGVPILSLFPANASEDVA